MLNGISQNTSIMLDQHTFLDVALLIVMSSTSQNSSNFSLLHLSSFSFTLIICFSCSNNIWTLEPLADKGLQSEKQEISKRTHYKQNPMVVTYDIVACYEYQFSLYIKVIITSLSRHTKPENLNILLLISTACRSVKRAQ